MILTEAHTPTGFSQSIFYFYRGITSERQTVKECFPAPARAPKGAKTASVLEALRRVESPFHIQELWKLCPEVSLDMVRTVLSAEAEAGHVTCLGRGKNARWTRNR